MTDQTSTTETGDQTGTSEGTDSSSVETTSQETTEEKKTPPVTTTDSGQVKAATQEAKTVVVDSGAIADSVISRIADKYDLTPRQTQEVKEKVEQQEKKEPERKETPPVRTPTPEHWKNRRIFSRKKNRD